MSATGSRGRADVSRGVLNAEQVARLIDEAKASEGESSISFAAVAAIALVIILAAFAFIWITRRETLPRARGAAHGERVPAKQR